jgi:hypothetical protein
MSRNFALPLPFTNAHVPLFLRLVCCPSHSLFVHRYLLLMLSPFHRMFGLSTVACPLSRLAHRLTPPPVAYRTLLIAPCHRMSPPCASLVRPCPSSPNRSLYWCSPRQSNRIHSCSDHEDSTFLCNLALLQTCGVAPPCCCVGLECRS